MICIIYNYIYIAGDSISGRRITWPGRLLFVDQEGRSPEGGPGRQLPVAFRVRLGVCPVGGGAIETEGWGVVQVGGMGWLAVKYPNSRLASTFWLIFLKNSRPGVIVTIKTWHPKTQRYEFWCWTLLSMLGRSTHEVYSIKTFNIHIYNLVIYGITPLRVLSN